MKELIDLILSHVWLYVISACWAVHALILISGNKKMKKTVESIQRENVQLTIENERITKQCDLLQEELKRIHNED